MRNKRLALILLATIVVSVVIAYFINSLFFIARDVAELETKVIEFLKTTDVPNGGWDNTVEIVEIYDHELGGKVTIVEYTTANGGHPGFFLEAIEHHVAVITFNTRGEVISAFCISGTFHDGKIWDLLNQRWIQE